MPEDRPVTLLCLSSEVKGQAFLRAAKQRGARVLLLIEERLADGDWPNESLDERFLMPDLGRRQDVMNAVSYLARNRVIDRIVPLDDYEVGTAAALREHMRLPGMNESTARYFRDKLAMRVGAAAAGLTVPAFVGIFHRQAIEQFLEQVPAPWVLKPRFEAGAVGIRKLHDAAALWQTLDELGDGQSSYLLEQFVPGAVYHVDSVFWQGEPQFVLPSLYGQPPLAVSHEGGVFSTRTLDPAGDAAQALRDRTAALLPALGLRHGVAHTEFIQAEADGQFYFLETAARVGGAHIAELVEMATGLNPWEEWAQIVLAEARGEPYQRPALRGHSAGLVICLARQARPDLAAYDDPEIVWRLNKPYHAGLIVAGPDAGRIARLVEAYRQRFARDFLTAGPPKAIQRTQA